MLYLTRSAARIQTNELPRLNITVLHKLLRNVDVLSFWRTPSTILSKIVNQSLVFAQAMQNKASTNRPYFEVKLILDTRQTEMDSLLTL